MVKMGIFTAMNNHTYTWNKETKLQANGGGIGDKLAGEAARLYLVWFDRQFMLLLESANLSVAFYKRYVDDGNIKAKSVSPGYSWDPRTSQLVLTCNPDDDTRSPDERTAMVFKDIANSVTPMLTWTVDFPSSHPDGKLPVLDIAIWCEETALGTVTRYHFYMKPVSNPVSIPARSALSKSIKFATYRQETYRVLRNTSIELPWEEKAELLSQLSWRMARSGYPEGFRAKVLTGGLTGHLKTLHKAALEGKPFHRSRDMISVAKKSKSSSDWFRGKQNEFRSVLFIPATPGSELVKRIRKIEIENNQGRQSRIRVVERSGMTIKDTISTRYPWAYDRCNKSDCFLCTTSTKNNVSCQKQGMGYIITCTACCNSGLLAQYEGETGRSLYERGSSHISEFKRKVSSNCMVIHNLTHHDGSTEFHFKMESIGHFRTPLDRQLNESLRIQHSNADILMNSGSEWRADRVPRAVFSAPGLRN